MRVLIVSVLVVCATAARADFFTFAEWQRLSPDSRSAYVAGAFDGAVSMATDGLAKAIFFRETNCIFRSKMTTGQLAEGVYTLGMNVPRVRGGSVAAAIGEYLVQMCPDLLGDKAIPALVDEAMGTSKPK